MGTSTGVVMRIMSSFLIYSLVVLLLVDIVGGLNCFRCHSSQAGCGKQVNIRLQRWHTCEGPGDGGGENFCVKVINKVGSEEFYTRECLMTLRQHTLHRRKMPTVQRHGYCEYGRNNDPWAREDKSLTYCFCNDWNGCNVATSVKVRGAHVFTFGAIVTVFIRYFL